MQAGNDDNKGGPCRHRADSEPTTVDGIGASPTLTGSLRVSFEILHQPVTGGWWRLHIGDVVLTARG